MLDYTALKALDLGSIRQTYTERDTLLYAVAVGFGTDPLDRQQLRYVYERDLVAVPTLAGVLGWPQFWARRPELGLNYAKVVQVDQDLRLFKPLPIKGQVAGRSRIGAVADRGEQKGAVVQLIRDLIDETDGSTLASLTQTLFMLGDGGFSKHGPSDPLPASLPPLPLREPDLELEFRVPLNAAFIYRLCGDLNPLHVDPDQAARGGFERPPLQGLCTYGMAAHAVLKGMCNYEAQRLTRIGTMFSSPVIPGDTLRFRLWKEDGNLVRIGGTAIERNVKVIDRGIAEVSPA